MQIYSNLSFIILNTMITLLLLQVTNYLHRREIKRLKQDAKDGVPPLYIKEEDEATAVKEIFRRIENGDIETKVLYYIVGTKAKDVAELLKNINNQTDKGNNKTNQ